MNMKKLKLAILNINNKNKDKNKGTKLFNNSSYRSNKLICNPSLNISSNNISNLYRNKNLKFSLSQNKFSKLRIDNLQNNNDESELLRDNLMKEKERYNEKNSELFNLKLKYNKLNKFHRENLKLLFNIMNRAGIAPNNEDIVNNIDISEILSKEEQGNLKERHLISCFKEKLLDYRNLIDKKDKEITSIKKSARISKLTRLENENACKSLENMNLSIEKNMLNNKLLNMETIMDSLNNKFNRLKKNENKNLLDIGDLSNKVQNLSTDISEKDKIIANLTKQLNKTREENKNLEKKVKNLLKEINKFEDEKKRCEIYIKEKDNYKKNEENLKKKLEVIKNENEKLTKNIKNTKALRDEFLKKYEELRDEKDKLLLIKEESKKKIKEKENQIKLIDEKI